MFPISRLSNFFLPTILVSTKALGGGRCGWLSIGCLADIKCTQTDHRSAKGRFPKSITTTTISPSLSASSSASSSPSWLQNSTTATELSPPVIFLCLFSPSILGERLLKRHCQEGLPGGATSDNSAAADDFVMIANDLLHSAAKSCSKDVVSIGMGQLEDGLCDAASGKTYANNIIRKRIQKTASPGGHWMKRAWHDLLWFISVGHWSALYKHLADAKDAQDKGGYGFNLCQPPNGLDLSRLVPGSCCLEGAPGPKAKVHRRSNWLVRWWFDVFFFLALGWAGASQNAGAKWVFWCFFWKAWVEFWKSSGSRWGGLCLGQGSGQFQGSRESSIEGFGFSWTFFVRGRSEKGFRERFLEAWGWEGSLNFPLFPR